VCWVPILKGKKLILAGDPMQLPPTVISVDKKKKPSNGVKPTSTTKSARKEDVKEFESNVSSGQNFPAEIDNSSDSEKSSGSEAEVVSIKEEKVKTSEPKPKGVPILRPPRTLETTLFDRLEKMYGSNIKRMLEVQYRFAYFFPTIWHELTMR
jgi:DNA polymerase alpha-associated DNA helicase A